ncbi:NAD-dependent epimerase/dehydratase [Caballeronia calidae]|uniref:NAD-dependent epimerase/dehydratase n=1 Tax=Caballeronia calidae TaxID=1777139 RepID=A0A158EL14_9BURK|nr:SDR family oxidoreductase [Caballeronia calidae]SAL07483.1 NAD-dependent epimerase/dehydratase [Caballeronia calidae]
MNQVKKTALVVGATGVVGRNLLRQLSNDSEWDVIAVSRRKPDIQGNYHHVSIDLLDPEEAKTKARELSAVTHVFFSAYIEKPTWAEMVAPNMALLRNLMDAIEPVATGLKHVNLMHGTKWYGNHLGPFKTPAKESDQGHMPPNFYYDQQAFIVERQKGKAWTWSAARPHGICGFAIGNPMNLVMVLAVYATISKALGLPLRHPGSEGNGQALYNVTDSGLLARACVWMATEPGAGNEPFNITNGDIFRWRDLWPAIARYFDMETAQAQKIDLVHMMADKGPLWSKLVKEHNLVDIPYDQLVGWKYGNFVFSPEFDVISSTTKARKYGFQESLDSEEMFIRHFDELRAKRIIP